MKVTRMQIMEWDKQLQEYVTVYEDSYEYEGPVAEAKGGGDSTTTTVQEADPPEYIQPYLTQAAKDVSQLRNNFTPQLYEGPTIAGMSPYTEAAVAGLANVNNSTFNQGIINAGKQAATNLNALSSPEANPLLNVSGNVGQQGSEFLQNVMQQGSAPSVYEGTAQNIAQGGTANPYIDDVVRRALGSVTRNTIENQLPAIQTNALQGNSFGGSRQGIAEGLMFSRLNDTLADTAANLYANEFNRSEGARLAGAQLGGQLENARQARGMQAAELGFSGLDRGTQQVIDATTRQATLLPGLQALPFVGLDAMMTAGNVDQSYRQALLDDEIARFNFTQAQPLQAQNDYINQLAALAGFGGTTTATSTAPDTSPSTASSVLGGAMSGAAMGSVVPGIGTGIGAVIGGLGGLLL